MEPMVIARAFPKVHASKGLFTLERSGLGVISFLCAERAITCAPFLYVNKEDARAAFQAFVRDVVYERTGYSEFFLPKIMVKITPEYFPHALAADFEPFRARILCYIEENHMNAYIVHRLCDKTLWIIRDEHIIEGGLDQAPVWLPLLPQKDRYTLPYTIGFNAIDANTGASLEGVQTTATVVMELPFGNALVWLEEYDDPSDSANWAMAYDIVDKYTGKFE
jgi:hypothetical protein